MKDEESTDGRVPVSIDVDTFALDPLILGRLSARQLSVPTVAFVTFIGTWIAITWCALASQLMYDNLTTERYLHQIVAYVQPARFKSNTLPLLRDLPSLIMGVTIPVSIAVVYHLFNRGAQMHSSLADNGCMRFSAEEESHFRDGVAALNAKLKAWGRWSFVALVGCALVTLMIVLRQSSGLYNSSQRLDLFSGWWASSRPFRPGLIIWVILGTLGTYVLYVEAVLGIMYVSFMRSNSRYGEFSANALNPDGYYGWGGLRIVLTNMEAGIVLTGMTSIAMWPLLSAAFGVIASAVFELVFIGVVAYVFFGLTTILRRVVDTDRRRQVLEIQSDLGELSSPDADNVLKSILAYQRLDMVERLPRSPLRRGSIVILSVSLLAPILEIVVAVLHYVQE